MIEKLWRVDITWSTGSYAYILAPDGLTAEKIAEKESRDDYTP